MLSTSLAVLLSSLVAAPGTKLPTAVATEMQDAILAANKALGLESWPLRGVKACVDRGGDGSSTRLVSAAETRTCAATVLTDDKFKGLGRDYAIAILMASVGPETVLAYGLGENSSWGAYSCDPDRKCRPLRLEAGTKWGKRLLDRQARACSDAETVWFPSGVRACPGAPQAGAPSPAPGSSSAAAAGTTPPPAPSAGTPPPPAGTPKR